MFSKHTTFLLLSTLGAAIVMVAVASKPAAGGNNHAESYSPWRHMGGGEESRGRAEEPFAECVYRPTNKHIFSVAAEMQLFDKDDTYELALSEFRYLVADNSLRRTNFIVDLNRVPEIVETGRGSPFAVVYAINNDVLIHRGKAFYGFHIRFDKWGVPTVRGVLNHYDIVSKYT